MDPGASTGPLPPTAPSFLILTDNSTGGQTPFPFTVVAGDLVLLANPQGGTDSGNWTEVVQFENVGTGANEHGLAILYTQQDWSGFVLDSTVKYVLQNNLDGFTSYTPSVGSGTPLALGVNANGSGTLLGSTSDTFLVQNRFVPEIPAPVPEYSTWLTGLLVLLPLGISSYRILLGRREAQ